MDVCEVYIQCRSAKIKEKEAPRPSRVFTERVWGETDLDEPIIYVLGSPNAKSGDMGTPWERVCLGANHSIEIVSVGLPRDTLGTMIQLWRYEAVYEAPWTLELNSMC